MNESGATLLKTHGLGFVLSFFSNAVFLWIVDSHALPLWLIILIISALIVVSMFADTVYRKFTIAARCGLVDYRHVLTKKDEVRYWHNTKKDFLYFGVTGASIQDELRQFIANENSTCRTYRFLLMNPDGLAFRHQIAFQKGYDLKSMTEEHENAITNEQHAAKKRLDAFVATMYATQPALHPPRRVEIRLYNEVTPWWAYVIDSREMALGLIIADERKEADPAAILRKHKNDEVNLFSAFMLNIDRLWNSATLVPMNEHTA